MYCPQCKAEYREGFKECADCGIALVAVLPASVAEEDALVDLEEVLSTANRGEIALIKSLLEAGNIPYLAQGESAYAQLPVRFLVPREHIDRARDVLASFL